MTDAIPYEEMRRILGLPVRRTRISAPWAIRKLDAGVHVGTGVSGRSPAEPVN
ncbi:hypothetical protein [Prescottella equi]|uniref:hypothetical protein n=1 Tax=Rhodococcus hoagii TaxID=43767 RepID=UPI001C75D791|nr:hypothetical protein [Prescottella equi]BCN83910.1 hypothetical protein RE0356_25510 [Prescottella equi]